MRLWSPKTFVIDIVCKCMKVKFKFTNIYFLAVLVIISHIYSHIYYLQADKCIGIHVCRSAHLSCHPSSFLIILRHSLSNDSKNVFFLSRPQTLLICSPWSSHREKVIKDINVSPDAFPCGHLINELENTHLTQREKKGRWDGLSQNEKARQVRVKRREGGWKNIAFPLLTDKGVIYLIIAITSVLQVLFMSVLKLLPDRQDPMW